MRPLKLTMQAFGPYAEKTVVDLEQLGGKGLYLVTGDTGAGKTTIFDGVCYALFGKASGDSRTVSMFRSEYARPEVRTFVELEFSYDGIRYVVHREPSQERPKLSGEGFTTMAPSAELFKVGQDRPLASNDTEVSAKIKEILGLDHKQYRNVAMIAQGSFAELLNTKTDSRTEILSAIFSTQKYRRLQEKLSEEVNDAQRRYNASNLNMSTMLGNVLLSDDDPFRQEIAQAASDPDSAAAAQSYIEETCKGALEFEKARADEAEKQCSKLREVSKQAALELENGRKLSELFKRLEDTKKELALNGPETEKAQQEVGQLEKRKPEVTALIEKSAAIREQLKLYAEAETLLKDADKLSAEAAAVRGGIEVLTKNTENNIGQSNKLKKLLETLADTEVRETQTRNEIEKCSTELANIFAIGKELSDSDKLRNGLAELEKKCIDAKNVYDEAEGTHRELFNAYISEQAGFIADKLEDGKPCPVCGSVHHPKKAKRADNAPDKSIVDAAKSALDGAHQALSDALNKHTSAKAKYEQAVKSAMEHAGKYAEGCTPQQALKNAREDYAVTDSRKKELQKELGVLTKQVTQKKQAEKDLEQLEKRIKQDEQTISQQQSRLAELTAMSAEKKAAAQKQLAGLPYKSAAEAKAQADKADKQRDAIEQAIKAADEKLAKLASRKNELSGKLGELTEQTQGKKMPDCKALEETLKKSDDETKQASKLRDDAAARLNSVKALMEKLVRELKNNRRLLKECSMKKRLSETANGTLKGKQRIPLETFVQMEYFDRILAHANKRLMIMSAGQYELVRSDEGKGTRKVGLDIDVKDYFTCCVRSVKSLSGGESFMASLALALGFSDEIQQTSGAVHIDSMFVDEGFGTLDEETLDKAISTLQGLAENSRLVGIISHVPELTKKLDKQIIVTKNKFAGSKVEIVT